jgi:anti-sigma regulatory factor (Ser/Thr protein kinase)
LTRLEQLRNCREAPDLFLQSRGVPAGPFQLDWVAREFPGGHEMSPDHRAGLVQVGEAMLPCGHDAPALARALISRWLSGHGNAELHADACLLVSELVTNSVRHARQPAGASVRITAAALDGRVRVEVEDQGHGHPRRRVPDPSGGGFGLHLVERLADRWGVDHEHCTRVWFELTSRSTRSADAQA